VSEARRVASARADAAIVPDAVSAKLPAIPDAVSIPPPAAAIGPDAVAARPPATPASPKVIPAAADMPCTVSANQAVTSEQTICSPRTRLERSHVDTRDGVQ
jgi:hypothetical protein